VGARVKRRARKRKYIVVRKKEENIPKEAASPRLFVYPWARQWGT
jgi:hypothetical protein